MRHERRKRTEHSLTQTPGELVPPVDSGSPFKEMKVIHSVALGGPECRAGLGGSIKWAAVRLVEARHRSELARACASWRAGRPGPGRTQVADDPRLRAP